MTRTIRIAAAQYPIDEITSFAAFEEKLLQWVQQAVAHGAQLLAFPEYGGMELARIAGRHVSRDLQGSAEAVQYYIGHYEAAYAELAQRHGVFILAGSAPVRLTDGRFVNRARLFGPKGGSGFQQKHIMTRFEAEQWGIGPSSGLCVFDIGVARIGVAICYDAEFPLIARALAEAGAEILLVPSCTESLAGYHRVRHACAARSLENQIYVVHTPTVGDAPWLAALVRNVGSAAVLAPPDSRLPANGILAEGALGEPQWVYAALDLDLLADVRKNGDVFNARDWNLQPGAPVLPQAKAVTLR
ncbi:MAG: carbon-nitrogen hydrolase family protein [Rhodomicrobium sp.]|jgi:predicted amidohydrolase